MPIISKLITISLSNDDIKTLMKLKTGDWTKSYHKQARISAACLKNGLYKDLIGILVTELIKAFNFSMNRKYKANRPFDDIKCTGIIDEQGDYIINLSMCLNKKYFNTSAYRNARKIQNIPKNNKVLPPLIDPVNK